MENPGLIFTEAVRRDLRGLRVLLAYVWFWRIMFSGPAVLVLNLVEARPPSLLIPPGKEIIITAITALTTPSSRSWTPQRARGIPALLPRSVTHFDCPIPVITLTNSKP